jgi:hypothetical protein
MLCHLVGGGETENLYSLLVSVVVLRHDKYLSRLNSKSDNEHEKETKKFISLNITLHFFIQIKGFQKTAP